MKVVQSVRYLYDENLPYYKIIASKVSETLIIRKKESWHFVGRVKSLESFALKLESGRFDSINILSDFYACTLVVSNIKEINNCESLARSLFKIHEKKPRSNSFTHKNSDSFPFDDLRLYCSLSKIKFPGLSDSLYDLIFEIQIKTFLQHAWGLATHDLIYKTPKISWAKERVAYQVKAILEQAELTIDNVSNLSTSNQISKDNKKSKRINRIIGTIRKHFDEADLPEDLRRLSQNIDNLLLNLNVSIPNLDTILTLETIAGRGVLIKDLSPYIIVLNSMYYQRKEVLLKSLRSIKSSNYKFLLTSGSPILDESRLKSKNVIRLNT